MSTAIVELIAGDRGPQFSNSGGARTFTIGSTWNVIRLGILFNFTDLGSGPAGTPKFYLGVLNGTAAANHVLKSTTTNFFGCLSKATTWTRNAGPPVYYSQSSSITSCKKVGATLTEAAGPNNWNVSAAVATRNVLLLEITKGSPNWASAIVYGNSATTAQADKTLILLKQALEAATMAGAVTVLGSSYLTSTLTAVAFTEAPAPDAVHFAWDKSSFLANIFAVGYAKIS